MKEFVYDNSFEGLLTAIFYSYSEKDELIITKEFNYIPSLLNDVINVKTEQDKFERVYNSIKTKLSDSILQNIYYLYLCSIEESDTLSLKYLKLCYKYGVKVNLAKNNDIIIKTDRYIKKVSHEAHNFKGFVRFKEIAPMTFYSSIEPDHNILPLIMSHFAKRFSDQNFIIHDIKRNTAIVYNKSEAFITDFRKEDAQIFIDSEADKDFENLWKTFYSSVNIKERKNLRLRNQHMPKRYWNHITEFN